MEDNGTGSGSGRLRRVDELVVVVSIGLIALTVVDEVLFTRALTRAAVLLVLTAGEEDAEEDGDLVKIRFAKAERRLLGRDRDDDRGGGGESGTVLVVVVKSSNVKRSPFLK
jgi:hypothetical protein